MQCQLPLAEQETPTEERESLSSGWEPAPPRPQGMEQLLATLLAKQRRPPSPFLVLVLRTSSGSGSVCRVSSQPGGGGGTQLPVC